MKWLLGLLRPYRAKVALMFAALIVATAAGLAPPYLAGEAIDSGINEGDVGALNLIAAIFVASAIVYALASYAQTYLTGWVGQRVLQDLRERIFAHLQRMSIGFFTRRSPGVLISRMTNDVAGARPARLGRDHDALLEHPDAAGSGRDHARARRRSWRW